MKRIKYGGTYKVEPGDFLVYQNNGKSVITERELRGREMPVFVFPWVSIKTQYKWNKTELVGDQKKQICDNCVHYSGKLMCHKRRAGAHFDAPAICPDYEPNLEEKKMKNYFVLDGKQIPMSDETAASLRDEQKTYGIGDCFRVEGYDTIVMLTQCGGALVVAICLSDGNYWRSPIKVISAYKITKGELERILGNNYVYHPVTIKVEVVQ